MPSSCCIVGCTNRGGKNGSKVFRFPGVRRNEGKDVEELTKRRLRLWVKAVNRKGITASTIKPHHIVCSAHFVKGKPAYYHSQTDPDWVPSLKLGYGQDSARHIQAHARSEARKRRKLDLQVAESQLNLSSVNHPSPCNEPDDSVADEFGNTEKTTMTEVTGQPMESMSKAVNDMAREITDLKEKLHHCSFNEDMFKGNNENVKYYTGLPSWEHLMCLISFLQPVLIHQGRNSLSKFQEILLVLIKLRLGLSYKIIGDFFQIDKSTVSRIFSRVLIVMYHNMKFLIHWPNRDCLTKTMPPEYVKCFGRRVVVIIDCFEVVIERPTNIKARAQTYSNYKSNNTIKYLIGITPQGCISYISEGWGGGTSDKHIVEHSDLLSKLECGDIVLANRGFDVQDSVNMMCAELKIPAFTGGKKQLSPFEVESTRKLARLRMHVERIIGNTNVKYTILNTEIPIDYLLTSEQDVSTLDQIVTVCAGLTNLCPLVEQNMV